MQNTMPTVQSGSNRALRSALINYGPMLAALLVEVVLFDILGRRQGAPPFIALDNAILVLNQSAVYGVMAVGMTFVILTGGIDLAVGSFLAFGGVICAMLVRHGGDSVLPWLLLGYVVAIAAGAGLGACAGGLITGFGVPPFIATLALMSTVRGVGNLMTDGKPIAPMPAEYAFLGRYQIGGQVPVSLLVFLVVLFAGWLLLEHTTFGRHVRAIGGNEEAARLSGVPVRRVKFLVYVLCGALAVVAGLILSSRLGSGTPKAGLGDELAVIAAVVVGGTSLSGGRGSILGTFAGLLVVAVLNSGLTWIGVETFGQQVTLGIVILLAVLLDRLKAWS